MMNNTADLLPAKELMSTNIKTPSYLMFKYIRFLDFGILFSATTEVSVMRMVNNIFVRLPARAEYMM